MAQEERLRARAYGDRYRIERLNGGWRGRLPESPLETISAVRFIDRWYHASDKTTWYALPSNGYKTTVVGGEAPVSCLRKTQCWFDEENSCISHSNATCANEPYREEKLLLKRDRHRDKKRAYRQLDSINYERIGWPSTSASPAHRKKTATPSGRHDSRYRMQPRPTDTTPPLHSLHSTALLPTSTRTSLVPISPPCRLARLVRMHQRRMATSSYRHKLSRLDCQTIINWPWLGRCKAKTQLDNIVILREKPRC